MLLALLVAALVAGMSSARAQVLASRAGVGEPSATHSIISLCSVVATFAALVLTFLAYAWWTPLAAFAGVTLLVGLLVNRATWMMLWHLAPIVGSAAVMLCVGAWYAWLSH